MGKRPLLIFRLGYMEVYDGPAAISSGGAYPKKYRRGGEMWNFAHSRGYCFGYVMTVGFAGLDAARIAKFARRSLVSDAIDGVDVAFIARKPGVGQVVVGFYRNATILHKHYDDRPNPAKGDKRRRLDYVCKVPASGAYLIPPARRGDFRVPFAPIDGAGYPGHSHVWYGDASGSKVATFLGKLRDYLDRIVREFPSMDDPKAVRECVAKEEENAEQRELDRIRRDVRIGKTTREQLVRARVGQGKFRKDVEAIEACCRVTGLTDRRFLRASHIKPWARSTNREKLDGANGFLLAPHVDHLFDKGYITFLPGMALKLSTRLPGAVARGWKLPKSCHGKPFSAQQKKYLRYHLQRIFR